MIDPAQPELSMRRQCELLTVSRSGLYYKPEPTSPDELALMRPRSWCRAGVAGAMDGRPPGNLAHPQ